MAGIGPKSGPTEKFIFRYQYLLIQIGTEVFRKLFDILVGNDFIQYLKAKPIQNNQLLFLISKDIITDSQKKFLPPVDMKPDSANFDVTLLACLLRNVCGLRSQKDPVWNNPPATDLSIEADITRLRECRNNLLHSGKVFISETALTTKWNELSTILNRLNNTCKIADLATQITNAETMDTDEELKSRHDETVKLWWDMDRSVDHGIGELTKKFEHLETGQTKLVTDVTKKFEHLETGQTKLMMEVTKKFEHLKTGQTKLVTDMIKKFEHLETGRTKLMTDVTKKFEPLETGQTKLVTEVTKKFEHLETGQTKLVTDVTKKFEHLETGQTKLMTEVTKKFEHLETGQTKLVTDVTKKFEHLETGQTKLMTDVTKKFEPLETGQTKLVTEVTKKFEHLETGQTKLVTEVAEMKKCLDERGQAGTSDCDIVEKVTALKQRLIETYNRDCCTLPLSPLYQEEEEDFFQVYQPPTMHQIDYHSPERTQENNSISSYRDIFVKDEQCFQNIYVTGDAGVGKTSLSKCLSLLWCKSQTGVTVDDPDKQSDINFLARFEFLFYISLRDTECRDVVSMIADQFFYSDSKEQHATIEYVLRQHKCLVVFDAFDEWSPKLRGKRECRIPDRVHSDNCVYLTTCRPYKIENVRLSRREIDQHVSVSGIHGDSSKCFIEQVVKHLNKENSVDKNAENFMREVEECGLSEQLCIPMIASHMVVVWFTQNLTDMSKALLYGKIVELLFTRARLRNVKSPASPTTEVQLPEILSKFRFLYEHKYLIQKLSLLSFKSLFKQDGDISLVFTRQQLMSEPYLLSDKEMDFLCKIGVISKHKVIGFFEEPKQKLSFLHKSYMEFLAALFVSSFDAENEFDRIAKAWTSVNDVVQLQNFFTFYAGLSYQNIKPLFDNIYQTISNDLAVSRRNSIFHHKRVSYKEQIKLLQSTAISCWKEGGKCNDPKTIPQLQDFVFDDDSNVDDLKQFLSLDVSSVKSLHLYNGRYLNKLNRTPNLQCLNVRNIEPSDYTHFNECMLQNQATLHTVSITGNGGIQPMVLGLPVKIPRYLTSLCLSNIKMQHKGLQDLVHFLSDNVRIEDIFLEHVCCIDHQKDDHDCKMTVTLSNHTKLTTLCLSHVNIVCRDINTSSLKTIYVTSDSQIIGKSYVYLLHCIKDSQVENLLINGNDKLDYNTIEALISTVKSLQCIKALGLHFMNLPDDIVLQLHPGVSEVEIVDLFNVTMSCQYFHCFVDSVAKTKKSIKDIILFECKISSLEGEAEREMSVNESIDYMSEYLTSHSSTNVTYKGRHKDEYLDGNMVAFEPTN